MKDYVFDEEEFKRDFIKSWKIYEKKILASQAYVLCHNLQSMSANPRIPNLAKLAKRRFERRRLDYEKLAGVWNFRHEHIMEFIERVDRGTCD